MNELTFLDFKKLKNGKWECRDKQGRTATGLTKQMAENQYYVLYQIGQPKIDINVSKFINPIGPN